MAALWRQPTAGKASGALMDQLGKSLKDEGPRLAARIKGIIVFDIDGTQWTLDLREGTDGALYEGEPKGGKKADLTLTISDTNLSQLVAGKLNPQQAFLMRKLKINGAMALAMKLQPVLDAAAPKAKL